MKNTSYLNNLALYSGGSDLVVNLNRRYLLNCIARYTGKAKCIYLPLFFRC